MVLIACIVLSTAKVFSQKNSHKKYDNGYIVRTFTGHNDWVMSVDFSPDGKYVLSGSNDHTLKL